MGKKNSKYMHHLGHIISEGKLEKKKTFEIVNNLDSGYLVSDEKGQQGKGSITGNLFNKERYIIPITEEKISLAEIKLHSVYFFAKFDNKIIREFSRNFTHIELPKHLTITTANRFEEFFFVEEGEIEIEERSQVSYHLMKNDYFGEINLIFKTNFTICTLSDTVLLSLSKENYLEVKKKYYQDRYRRYYLLLNDCIMFNGYTPNDLEIFLMNCTERTFNKNQSMIIKGKEFECLYIMTKGEAACYSITEELKKYFPGDVICSAILFEQNNNVISTVVANTKVKVLEINIHPLELYFQANIKDILYKNLVKRCMKVNVFGSLYESMLDSLYDLAKINNYKMSENLVKGVKSSTNFYIILGGTFKNGSTELKVLDYVNMLDLQNRKTDDTAVITASENSTAAVISKSDLMDKYKYSIDGFFNMNFLYDSLKNLLLFKFLNNKTMMNILSHIKILDYNAGSVLAYQSEMIKHLIVIKSGNADIFEGRISGKILKEGDCIGEDCYIKKASHTASVIARTNVEC